MITMECALLVLKAIEDSAGAGLPAGWLNVRGLCLHALCVHMSTEAFKDVCPYLCVCVCEHACEYVFKYVCEH